MPLGLPHPATADRSKAVSAPREDQREPPSSVVSSEQEPSWLVVVGLDNAPGEQHRVAEECLDVLGLDPVLPVLGSVAGIPIEILPATLKTVQPRGNLLVVGTA